jgi:ADP-heptose:LPS heptosyltransferase
VNQPESPLLTLVGGQARRLEGLFRPGTRRPTHEARNILVLQYAKPLGSCVHMTPLYEALKRDGVPRCVVVAGCGLGLEVLRHSPYVDHLIQTPDPLRNLRAAAESLRGHLRQLAFPPDGCLTGLPDQRSRIALLAALVCPGWRGGYTVHPKLYHHPLFEGLELSQIQANLLLAELVGASSDALEPRVFYSAADVVAARELLQPVRRSGQPVLIAVTQTSGGQRSSWHRERWLEVLRHARNGLGYEVVYVGTAADHEAVEGLRSMASGISLAGKTTVHQLAALLALSDLIVSVDTGTMHVGRAVRTPMVVMGPSWQRAHEWLPLGRPQCRILRGADRKDIPADYQLDEITVKAVLAAIQSLSAAYPASEAAREFRAQAGVSEVDLLRR